MNIQEVRMFLKQNFDGPEVVKALKFRLETHLSDPTLDPLVAQVWPAYNQLPQLLRAPFTLLDAGCMSGFLYHFLQQHFTDFKYTGYDRWPEALEVGREFAPGVEFVQKDFLLDPIEGSWDYVVCSNIPFKGLEEYQAIEQLRPHARIGLLMIYPNSRISIFGPSPASHATPEDAGSQKADIQA